jgi:hypothetical protein
LAEHEQQVRRNNYHLVERMTVINTRVGISEEFGGLKAPTKAFSPEQFRIQSMNYVVRKKEQ